MRAKRKRILLRFTLYALRFTLYASARNQAQETKQAQAEFKRIAWCGRRKLLFARFVNLHITVEVQISGQHAGQSSDQATN